MPEIPVLPETLLRLDLEIHEPCVNLRVISDAVLSDLGATLQILHLAGREYGHSKGRPTRIVECIADLGLRACMGAVSGQTVIHSRRHKAIGEIWAHSREIACYAKLKAEEMPKVNPDEAYLVGLLHGLGSLPGALGWNADEAGAKDPSLAGFRLATQWALPFFVLQYFSEVYMGRRETHWSEVLRYAHRRAGDCFIDCAYQQEARPMLLQVI
jgi:hypothetical protein